MELDRKLDLAMQLFVYNREARQHAEHALAALRQKEEDAANALARLVNSRVKP
jgi:hypothetical protein